MSPSMWRDLSDWRNPIIWTALTVGILVACVAVERNVDQFIPSTPTEFTR